ncbi:hypothetical protein, partial [Capnocytophaga sputigena]
TNKRRCEPHEQIEKRRRKPPPYAYPAFTGFLQRRNYSDVKTNNERRKGGEMMKDKACKIVEKVEFVEGDYG